MYQEVKDFYIYGYRLTGYKFIKGSEECASGEIKCSSRICVNGGSCPITNIKVVESKSDKSGF